MADLHFETDIAVCHWLISHTGGVLYCAACRIPPESRECYKSEEILSKSKVSV